MTAIQAIYVRGHEERPEPKTHIVFRIEIQAHVRSWQMWRRYSEFADLHTELTKSVGAPPPQPLPPKHAFSMLRSRNNEVLLEERRAGLEVYLRAILSAKDPKWLESFAFRDFLGVPVGKHADPSDLGSFTSSSWLDEHIDLQARVRDIRADINRRDAFSDRGDVSASHTANVQAKKKLAAVLSRAGTLAQGLEGLGMSGMSEGELQRRTDMVARLQDDCEKLGRMLTVARNTSRGLGAAAERNPAASSDRAALLEGSPWTKPVARVFGGAAAQPRETEATRPLDSHGLLQLQETQIEQQDAQLAQLTAILHRQKQLGVAIGSEIAQQNELLDELSNDVDRVGGKLTAAKRQMNRLG
ncbi:syntaxin [Artomyces pyxidatus]|uniref:Syntaxin n=1 Tax=Artomyces pyxidatus TaxID=48021 RepID=A0ACB8TH30_9AGAM|nr:syntaxin [Artomyces pyxidatus]